MVGIVLSLAAASSCMGSDLRQVGLNLNEDDVERLDEIRREWDKLESSSVTRSAVAREVIPLGLVAWEVMHDETGRELFRLTTFDRESLVRQALLDLYREDAESE